MPSLHSSKEIIRVLERHGFYFVSQRGSHRGSHIKMRKDAEEKKTVIIPANKKVIPHGTFRSIVRQSGLSESDFQRK